MRKSSLSEEQIIAILGDQERGMATAEVCCRHGISSATFYKWKAKDGGLGVSDARKLKTLETENARLKRLMREHGLNARRRRRHVTTTDSDHDQPIFPDRTRDMIVDGRTSSGSPT